MSPASYLTAPPRVAANILAPSTIPVMLFWLPFAFLIVSLTGSIAWAALRGFRLWRAFRAVSGRLADEAASLVAKGEATEQRAGDATANAERLATAAERLQGSLAQLAVLRAAFAESRGAFGAARGTVPRK